MNFLAHASLSGSDEQLLIGNFIADAVKGNHLSRFTEGIRKGILLHREIDAYTDRHPVFIRSRERLQPEYGRYSGVIVDIYYDHFLASGYGKYFEEDLSEFALHVYGLMLRNYNLLPAKSKRILPYMIIHNWLVGYANFTDLQWVFNGMSRRSKRYQSGMENAVVSLKDNYKAFEEDFHAFFPDIMAHTISSRASL